MVLEFRPVQADTRRVEAPRQMLDQALDPQRPSTSDPAERRSFEWQRLALLGTCGAISGIIATVVAEGAHPPRWSSLASIVGTIFATFIVAAGVLRVVDAIAARQQIFASSRRSGLLGEETRRLLVARDPEVEARAARIDAADLVGRVVKERKGSLTRDRSNA